MLPFNPGGHAAYQDFVFIQLRKHYPNPDSLPRDTWEIIEHFYQKDLSHVDEMLKDRYSIFGPAPRLPSCMLRSYLLGKDSVPICMAGRKMNHDGVEKSKLRIKFRCLFIA